MTTKYPLQKHNYAEHKPYLFDCILLFCIFFNVQCGKCYDCVDDYIMYMWQSRVEIEHYSVVYFDRITAFEVL